MARPPKAPGRTPAKAPGSQRERARTAGPPGTRVPIAPGTRPARGDHGGRPSSLTPETEADIVRMLERGAYLTHAAGAVGVDRRTLYRWMEVGGADLAAGRATPEASFWEAVGRARAKGRVAMVEVIEGASKRDWRAAAWMLERTDPELFGERVELSRRPDARGDAPPPDADAGKVRSGRELLEADAIDLLTDGELELLEKLREREVQVLTRARSRRADLS